MSIWVARAKTDLGAYNPIWESNLGIQKSYRCKATIALKEIGKLGQTTIPWDLQLSDNVCAVFRFGPDCLVFVWLVCFGSGERGENASCTVAPEGTLCGTPVRLASRTSRPLDKSAA